MRNLTELTFKRSAVRKRPHGFSLLRRLISAALQRRRFAADKVNEFARWLLWLWLRLRLLLQLLLLLLLQQLAAIGNSASCLWLCLPLFSSTCRGRVAPTRCSSLFGVYVLAQRRGFYCCCCVILISTILALCSITFGFVFVFSFCSPSLRFATNVLW